MIWMRPQPPLLARASLADCPPYVGEWQEMLSLAHPRAEPPLVASPPPSDLLICAKDLFVEATQSQPDPPPTRDCGQQRGNKTVDALITRRNAFCEFNYDIVIGTALPPPKLRRAALLRYAHRAPSRGSHVPPEISNAHSYRSAHLSARSECRAKSGGRKRLAPPSLCRCSVSKDHVVS